MKITRQISLSFESEECTEDELEAAAEYKLHEIWKSIGQSGIFPLHGDIRKKVIWYVKPGESIIPVNRKGKRCIRPQGPPICQEGLCGNCAVPKTHKEN